MSNIIDRINTVTPSEFARIAFNESSLKHSYTSTKSIELMISKSKQIRVFGIQNAIIHNKKTN